MKHDGFNDESDIVTFSTSEEMYHLCIAKYGWTFDYCMSLHPYWLLVALGWLPISAEQAKTPQERVQQMRDRYPDPQENRDRPPHYPKDQPWPPRPLNS